MDKDTKERLALGERVVEVLKQGRNSPLSVEDQVIIIYAVTKNYLHDVPVDRISEFESGLFDFMASTHPEVPSAIVTTGQLSEETETALRAALDEYLAKFKSENGIE